MQSTVALSHFSLEQDACLGGADEVEDGRADCHRESQRWLAEARVLSMSTKLLSSTSRVKLLAEGAHEWDWGARDSSPTVTYIIHN